MFVVSFLNPSEPLAGKKLSIKPGAGFGIPHIHLQYRIANRDVPETDIFLKNYTMQLEFGTPSRQKLPGKIYLCLPDGSWYKS